MNIHNVKVESKIILKYHREGIEGVLSKLLQRRFCKEYIKFGPEKAGKEHSLSGTKDPPSNS